MKAPFPRFGGKSRAAALVWAALGPVEDHVEPFAGSLAVLLARDTWPKTAPVETVNDLDCFVANLWRAVALAPDVVARYATGPAYILHLADDVVMSLDEADALRGPKKPEGEP